jgi:hypothetical protein
MQPFLPRTFSGGGYDVTINGDRSINVRPGDWLSKYSMAIYGNFDHIDKFWEKKGSLYQKITNKDLIKAGDTLYHPDPLPNEPPGEEVPQSNPPMQSRHAADFLKWIMRRFVRTEWAVEDTGGFDLSVTLWTFQYGTIGVRNTRPRLDPTPQITWFHAIANGLTFGFPSEGFTAGGSFSTTQIPGAGIILRAPWCYALTLDDFRHGIIVLEFAANFVYVVGGGNVQLLIFGFAAPYLVLAEIGRFFRTGDLRVLESALYKAAPKGVMLLGGGTLGIPGGSVAGRIGFMYDRGYVGI